MLVLSSQAWGGMSPGKRRAPQSQDSSRCPFQQQCRRSLGTLPAPSCPPAMSPAPWQPELHTRGTAGPWQFPAPAPRHRGILGDIGAKTSSTSTLVLPPQPGLEWAQHPWEQPVLLGGPGKGRREMWMLPAPALPRVPPPCPGRSLHRPAPSCSPPGNSGTAGPGPCSSPTREQCPEPAQKATSPFVRPCLRTPSLQEEPQDAPG